MSKLRHAQPWVIEGPAKRLLARVLGSSSLNNFQGPTPLTSGAAAAAPPDNETNLASGPSVPSLPASTAADSQSCLGSSAVNELCSTIVMMAKDLGPLCAVLALHSCFDFETNLRR